MYLKGTFHLHMIPCVHICLRAIWINSGLIKGFKSNLPNFIDTQVRTQQKL